MIQPFESLIRDPKNIAIVVSAISDPVEIVSTISQ